MRWRRYCSSRNRRGGRTRRRARRPETGRATGLGAGEVGRAARPITPPAQPRPKIGSRHIRAQPQPPHEQRVQAGGRDTGRRDATTQSICPPRARRRRGFARGFFDQLGRVLEIERVALGPTMRPIVPVDRHGRIARIDAGIAENRDHAVEIVLNPARHAEDPWRAVSEIPLLGEDMLRNGGGEREQARFRIGHGRCIPFDGMRMLELDNKRG